MAKNSILDYDTTPDNNTDMGGIGIQGTSAVNNFDNAFRTLMSQIADWTGSSTIASGTTTDLSAVKGMYVSVSGTATITSFGTAKAGWMKYVRFTSTPTLTYNATSMILPGAASIAVQAGDFGLFVSEGSGNWRCLEYTRAATLVRPAARGYLYDLGLSNNISDSVNDIDIGTGECASTDTIPVLMQLNSTLTKRLDAAWAVGNGAGGLDTGSIANTTYHVYLIQRSDTGVVDALFSTNATTPTMPANYDRRRRIGSIIRSGGTIVGFTQRGDHFLMPTVEVRNSTATTANSLITCPTPLGIRTSPMFDSLLTISGAGSDISNGIGSGDLPSPTFSFQRVFGGGGYRTTVPPGMVFTDRNSQVRFSAAGAGTITTNVLACSGWIDLRGRTGGD